jgi:hypothetical protein
VRYNAKQPTQKNPPQTWFVSLARGVKHPAQTVTPMTAPKKKQDQVFVSIVF